MHLSYEQWCESHTNVKPMLRRMKSSLPEQYIGFYLSKNLYTPIEYGKTFSWLGKMSLDIYLPEYSIAIEYDGYFFHNEKGHYDKQKTKLCAKHGIRIIRFREIGLAPIIDGNTMVISYANSPNYSNIADPIKVLIRTMEQTIRTDIIIDIDIDRDQKEIVRYIQNKFYINTMAYHWPEVFDYWVDSKTISPYDLYTRDKTVLKCPHCGNLFIYYGRYFHSRKSLIPCHCEIPKIDKALQDARQQYIDNGTLVTFDESLSSRRLYDRMKLEVDHFCFDDEHHCMNKAELRMYKKFGVDLGWKDNVITEEA